MARVLPCFCLKMTRLKVVCDCEENKGTGGSWALSPTSPIASDMLPPAGGITDSGNCPFPNPLNRAHSIPLLFRFLFVLLLNCKLESDARMGFSPDKHQIKPLYEDLKWKSVKVVSVCLPNMFKCFQEKLDRGKIFLLEKVKKLLRWYLGLLFQCHIWDFNCLAFKSFSILVSHLSLNYIYSWLSGFPLTNLLWSELWETHCSANWKNLVVGWNLFHFTLVSLRGNLSFAPSGGDCLLNRRSLLRLPVSVTHLVTQAQHTWSPSLSLSLFLSLSLPPPSLSVSLPPSLSPWQPHTHTLLDGWQLSSYVLLMSFVPKDLCGAMV